MRKLSMRVPRFHQCYRLVAFAAALVTAAACGESMNTAPEKPSLQTEPFDAAHALASFEPLAAVFDQNIFDSFDGVGSVFESFYRSNPSIVDDLGPAFAGSSTRVMRRLTSLAGIRASDVPIGARGATYVYDLQTKLYVADPNATGAPANGARFILYAWDAPSHGPALPLTHVGYVDLVDVNQSTVPQELTRITIVRDGAGPTASFVIGHIPGMDASAFGINGSASDDKTSVEIGVSGADTVVSGRHQLIINSTLSSSSLGVTAHERITFNRTTAETDGKLELTYANHTFTDENVGTGLEMKFDGRLYATVVFPTTPEEALRYLKTDGSPLSGREVEDLTALLNRVVSTEFLWVELAWP
jgi:hypothetical protein